MFCNPQQVVLFFPPGNLAAGLASGLHVMLYVIGLSMILSNKYFGTKICLELATISTITVQAVFTCFGSYKHFAIANADTLPAAIMVSVIDYTVNYVEQDFKLQEEVRCGCPPEDPNILVPDDARQDCACTNPGAAFVTIDGTGEMLPDGRNFTIPPNYAGYGDIWDPMFHTCYEDIGDDEDLFGPGSCFIRVQTTVLVALIACSTITGLALFGMGKLRMGSFISFVPFPVQCAFLAACGFKILKAGIGFMVDIKALRALQLGTEGLESQIAFNLGPIVGMAVFIMWAEHHFHHHKLGQWVLPGILIFLTLCFYAFIAVVGYGRYSDKGGYESFKLSLADCRAGGNQSFLPLPAGRRWLMTEEFQDAVLFTQYSDFRMADVRWGAIFSVSCLGNSLILWLVTVMAVLMNSSILEEKTNRDIDFDNELKVAGFANALCGLVGGLTGFSTVPKTMMCYKMGGTYYSGLFTTGFFVAFLLFGSYLMPLLPLPVLGGFVVAIGLELMEEWIIKMKKEITHTEFIEVIVLFTVMSFGFVQGFVVGLFQALIVFAGKYSQLPTIKSAMTMVEYQGTNVWNHKQQAVLQRYGRNVLLIRLQGFIFFFTAEKLRKKLVQLIEHANDSQPENIQFLVLDFQMVDDMDGTSLKKIKKLMRFLNMSNITLILSSTTGLQKKLDREGIMASDAQFEDGTQSLYLFQDYALAVEHCAQHLLGTKTPFHFVKRNKADGKHHMKELIQGIIMYLRLGFRDYVAGEEFDVPAFRSAGSTKTYNVGDAICTKGDAKNTSMFYIAQGSIGVFIEDANGKEHRVMRQYRGTLTGEQTFFMGKPRSATVRATEEDTECVEVSHEAFETLVDSHPHIATMLSQAVIQKLGKDRDRQAREIQLLLQ